MLIGRFLRNFSQITGFRSSVQSFRMLWFDRLELNHINIYDPEGNRMIGAKEILINFKISGLLGGRDIDIDGIYIDSAHVYLTKINEVDSLRELNIRVDSLRDLNINVFINNINKSFSSRSGGTRRSQRVNIGEAFLNQSQFTYNNQDHDSITTAFDYNHFSLAVDEGQLKSFYILGDTTAFEVQTLSAQDLESKLRVHHLSTSFLMSQQYMQFLGLDVKVGSSEISDTLIFSYKTQLDLNDFVNEVKIHADFTNTKIYPADLAVFAAGAEKLKNPITLNGIFNGRINKFKLTQMKLEMGSSVLNGSLDMDGLPNINETFIIANLKNSILDPNDLDFVMNENALSRLQPMGKLKMDAQFLGYPNDFVANGSFSGAIGTIKSDLNLKINTENIDRSEYSGKLSLLDFDLGAYLNDTITFQHVNLDGKISGSGLTVATADFQLTGRISSIGLKQYNYTNITTDARFASSRFRGDLEIDDPNLQANVRGSIDLRDGRNQVRIHGRLDSAYLHRLNLSRDSVFLHAKIDADLNGLTLDSLQGTVDVAELVLMYRDEWIALNHVWMEARRNNNQRSLNIQSSLLDATFKGDYYFSDISRDIQMLVNEISLNIKNDKQEIAHYYQQKKYKPKTYEANIHINLKDIVPVTSLLNLDLSLTPNTKIEGRFTSGRTTIFNAYSSFDSLKFEGKSFANTEVELTTSKIADSTSVLSIATINSAHQQFTPTLKTKNLFTEAIWNKNHIDFTLDADHDGDDNYVRLAGMVDFMRDSTVISMKPSALKLLERDWTFAPDNFVSINGSTFAFHNLALTNTTQAVGVNGKLSKDPLQVLTMKVSNLDLSLLNVITDKKFTGTMNAQLDLSNYYKDPFIQNHIDLHDLTINEFLVGNVSGKNEWDTVNRKFEINLFIDRQEERIVNLTGDYDPDNARSPLNISARLEKANLKLIEPFLEGIFSQMGGTVSGDFRITGPLEAPEIKGEGLTTDGQLMVTYLKTMYRFTGKIGLTPTSIYFKDIEMTDAFRNKGKLNGAIAHKGFNSMVLHVNANFKNFQLLNTTIKDNSLFYGQAYGTGDLEISGPISNLRIASTARTDRNTRVYIPIGGISASEKKEFITFENFSDTTFTKKIQKDVRKKTNVTGLTLDFNFDITPDAYCEIIFDQKAGDIIRGRGNGDLKLELNTNGDFNMFGPFEFTEGWYNFTLYDIINKEFTINRGSRITWYGDPYQGVMDIDASYNQMASLAPLVTTTDSKVAQSAQLKRKYPVQVLLKLDGPMLNFLIDFDITANDLPTNVQLDDGTNINLELQFTAFKNKLDEQELKRQVFSLIVLRKFSPPESFDASGSVVNSLSELLSNQLSNWMSQVDEDLQIDVDIGAMDQEAFNTFQLRLSYTFLNGRLRVTGDGTFNNTSNSPSTAQSNPNTVAGDWTVDYMLTPDGKLRVKMYSRTNTNSVLSSVNNQNTMTTGASIIHTQSFDKLSDIWKSSREKRKKQEAADPDANKEAIKEEEGSE